MNLIAKCVNVLIALTFVMHRHVLEKLELQHTWRKLLYLEVSFGIFIFGNLFLFLTVIVIGTTKPWPIMPTTKLPIIIPSSLTPPPMCDPKK